MLNHTSLKLLRGMAGSWMKRAGYVHNFLTLMFLFAVGAPMITQAQEFRASGDIAMALFSSGKYNEAINHFEILAVQYPDDPLYKYYYGRTLLELDKDHDKAVSLLEAAVRGSTGLRPVPDDARFWLGRAFHRAGMFDRALDNYGLFSAGARRKDVRALNVAEYSDQAARGQGAATGGRGDAERVDNKVLADRVVEKTRVSEKAKEVVAKDIETRNISTEAKKKEGNVDKVEIERISVDGNYDIMAKEALALQFSADSVNRLADRYRERLSSLSGVERASAEQKILSLEKMGFRYQGRADTLFNKLTGRVGVTVVTPVTPVREKTVTASGNAAVTTTGNVTTAGNVAGTGSVAVSAADTLLKGEKKKASVSESDRVVQVDNKWIGSPGQKQVGSDLILPDNKTDEPVLMIFKKDQQAANAIVINPELPEGLVYRVQIAAFRNPLAVSFFKNFSPAYGIRAEGSDITVYFIGMFRKKSDADRAVAQLRGAGFNDAFVVPVNNGAKVSLERAAEMEKEWGNKSLVKGSANAPGPSTLIYRVEAARASKELKGDDAEAIRRVAGNRGLDIITAPDGKIVYLIGNFLTFESASGYADLIFRNGVGGAKVVAYLGNREIPIEKARELFELYNK